MKKLILMLGGVAAAFLSNADYLVWQITTEDKPKDLGSYSYILLNYSEVDGSKAGTLAAISTPDSSVMESTITTSLDNLKDGAQYSLFVEFVNYNATSKGWDQVGKIESQLTYTAGAVNAANIVVSDSMPATTPVSVPIWHGGAADVPEPTSGMMVVIGFAFLALKHRKV